ncbi:hypothetical protein TTHERM_00686130 (macronuclear) [Tetrahymena thermophila SB210]|uniref:Uncharacterized protein n=1 Tax=Tetrahymena thermophila (strain SB210) TaxID=312017 RepID=I7MJ18_TETTS|nr:hypothetical protein TTHERM_00686130 [Tetrahymena thermophila SB210]EAS04970.1 hypothetical protein TTHERM_00686130 [Tetrahymena thermophila SB210]|eukprot:XP_001025215.1 hypothetical protein TTHERM_00686130 [Tetrahymena thermophila SB210]
MLNLVTVSRPQLVESQHLTQTYNPIAQQTVPVMQFVTSSPQIIPVSQQVLPIQNNFNDQNFLNQSRSTAISTSRVNYQNETPRNVTFCVPAQSANNSSFIAQSMNQNQFESNPFNSQRIVIRNDVSPQRVIYQTNQDMSAYQNNYNYQHHDNQQFNQQNGYSKIRSNSHNFAKGFPNQNNQYDSYSPRQSNSGFNTPTRRRDNHLSFSQLQERMNNEENEKCQDRQYSQERVRLHTYSNDNQNFDPKEKNLKKKVEVLELQRSLIDDQLKFKEQMLENVSHEHSQCYTRIRQLEQTLVQVMQEKEENEQKLRNDLNQLKMVIQNLQEQNNNYVQQILQKNQIQ